MALIEMTDSGIVASTRSTIFTDLTTMFKNIYGSNSYLAEGTEDYNMLSLLADNFNDMGNVAVSVSQGWNLQTATGAQLDNISTLFYNTITRTAATNSTVVVTITGTVGTIISSGLVRDSMGGIWDLPNTVTIPSGGTIDVTATYSETGAYHITAGQINGFNSIVTPVTGWTSVTNVSESSIGTDEEEDAHYRYRLATKAQGQSNSVIGSLSANLASNENLPYNMIWENDTSSTISFASVGLSNVPAHSLAISIYSPNFSLITDTDIAQIIYNYKGTGVGTYAPSGGTGSTTANITNEFGTVQAINFIKAEVNEILIDISLQKISANSPDLSTTTETAIQTAVIAAINEQAIGSITYAGNLYLTVSTAITNTVGANVYNVSAITVDSGASVQNLYYEKPFTQATDISIAIV